MSRWAPDNDEGLHAYVAIRQDMWDMAAGRDYRRIVYAADLKAAKAEFGWTRERYTTIKVRRATPDDLARSPR